MKRLAPRIMQDPKSSSQFQKRVVTFGLALVSIVTHFQFPNVD